MLKETDFVQLKEKGITKEQIYNHIKTFEMGIPHIHIHAPATKGNGIKVFNEEEEQELIRYFDDNSPWTKLLKFVPASGAATRMFKDIFALRDSFLENPDDLTVKSKTSTFLKELSQYAFYNTLKKKIEADGIDFEALIASEDIVTITDYMLFEKGLNYANTPKALIEFHKYPDGKRTSLEEHLVEGALYCKDNKGRVKLHLTVSPEHKKRIQNYVDAVAKKYEDYFGVSYAISYSVQLPSTDTLAVDLNNAPFRNNDGSLLFRPGGHGALIQNLNNCDEELIFIKNIDNIVPDRLKETTVQYKKIIGGLLLKLKDKVQLYLEKLENSNITIEDLKEIQLFAEKELFLKIGNTEQLSAQQLRESLFHKLNRPLRVCGMVKNEGEPGGGPFWVVAPDTQKLSLQIVEASQINLKDPTQKKIAQGATHFNPVDLVCWTKNYKGEIFDLTKYINKDTGFISVKSKDGKELKALELPGLWNGAMAEWNTIFVEVPIITFNPVKTIEDLLRKEHLNA